MSEKINWTLNVQVVGGPRYSTSSAVTVDAYDKIQITVDAQDTDKVVEVQPGAAGRVQFLLISSNQFGDDLTYKVNNTGNAIQLNAQHLLVGEGAVGLLGASSPNTVSFTNKLTPPQDVNIEILVGRNVTG
jgi:hypothetical protein